MYKDKCNRILIFCSFIETIDKERKIFDSYIKNIFKDKSIKSYSFTYKDSNNKFKEFLKEDDNYIKILYSIDKIIETYYIPD